MQYSFTSSLFWLVVAAIVVVYFVMLCNMLSFRKANKDNFHKSVLVELIWFLLPVLILAALMLPIAEQFLPLA